MLATENIVFSHFLTSHKYINIRTMYIIKLIINKILK